MCVYAGERGREGIKDRQLEKETGGESERQHANSGWLWQSFCILLSAIHSTCSAQCRAGVDDRSPSGGKALIVIAQGSNVSIYHVILNLI